MLLTDLATELLLHIFNFLPTIPSVLALSSTCRHFRTLISTHRLPLLYLAAEAQLGPLPDAIRLVTHNSTQPVHISRPPPPQSLALLQRLLVISRTANQIADLYPAQKWHGTELSSSRRSLTSLEARHLRRAVYRLWLYTLAFHNAAHTRRSRQQPPVIRSRALLLRPWPASELAEILDVQSLLRGLLQHHICPSNGTVLRRHRARYPHEQQAPPLIHNGYLKNNSSSLQQQLDFQAKYFHSTPQVSKLLAATRDGHRDGGAGAAVIDGWGDEIAHYYVLEDMLKLDPGQIMWLYEHVGTGSSAGPGNASAKERVQAYVNGVGGEWFENNGETFGETVAFVVRERGGEMEDLRADVEDGVEGVVRGAFG
ncbi:MAG: hypothetical protein Q9195_006180 [Heterodermia aff. obscurata]